METGYLGWHCHYPISPPLPTHTHLATFTYTHTHTPPHTHHSQLPWLEELYAYGNRISYLPHELSNLKKLRTLAINENLLSGLPGAPTVTITLSPSHTLAPTVTQSHSLSPSHTVTPHRPSYTVPVLDSGGYVHIWPLSLLIMSCPPQFRAVTSSLGCLQPMCVPWKHISLFSIDAKNSYWVNNPHGNLIARNSKLATFPGICRTLLAKKFEDMPWQKIPLNASNSSKAFLEKETHWGTAKSLNTGQMLSLTESMELRCRGGWLVLEKITARC